MSKHTLKEFLAVVEQKNMLQTKFLSASLSDITDDETKKFENLLNFYMSRENNTLEEIVDKYLNKIGFMMEDQRYFFENEKYRFSTFVEVENYYRDFSYMNSYTIGLGLSTYLWRVHRELLRLFHKFLNISQVAGQSSRYLEIGPGHGEYFVTAIQNSDFEQYTAVDISKTSVDLTLDYLHYSLPDTAKNCEVIHENIFNYNPEKPFDVLVMGEVLEHVEAPSDFLRKVYELTTNDATIFITTAINAPDPDHIYLFNNLAEIFELFEKENFTVIDYVASNANNLPLEKAEKRKVPIVPGFILKKKR